MPLPEGAKFALASFVLTLAAPLVRHSRLYRHWQATRRERAPGLATMRGPAGPGPGGLPRDFAGIFGASLARGPYFRPIKDAPQPPAPVRVIAFYLPQFHPFPENDAWWGKGFTEWTNVSRAVPHFAGHVQPKLPGELGFYDLRMKDVQRRQIELARRYGVHGFCYHHYWFAGKRLMETPFAQVLSDPSLDLPFCLCWANENWTRRWDGAEHDVLIAQRHSPEDDLGFIEDIAPALRDPRYIRVDGRPLLVVYRVSLLPDPKATVARWKGFCREAGLPEPYLVAAQTFGIGDPRQYGFDAAVEFPPHNILPDEISGAQLWFDPAFRGKVFRYSDAPVQTQALAEPPYTRYRCAFPGWDNTARKLGRAHVFFGASPARFADWMRALCRQALRRERVDERIVFVNAWNEWAEGAYLEPDRRNGYAYLEALGDVLADEAAADMPLVSVVIPAYQHADYIEAALDSVHRQTYERLEVIVVDDGSTDDTGERVARYRARHPERPLAYIRKANAGAPAAIHDGIAASSGEFVALLNSDDRYAPERISVMVEAMRSDGLELAFTKVAFIGPDGEAAGGAPLARRLGAKIDAIRSYPALIYACLDSNVAISTGNLVFRRRLYDRLGGFAPLGLCHDWAFVLAAAARYRIGFVDRELYAYRIHPSNTFAGLADRAEEETRQVLEGFFHALDIEQAASLFEDKVYLERFMRQRGYDRYVRSDSLLGGWVTHAAG